MEFTEDPFRDYRYEDPFNLEDPFGDVVDTNKITKGKPDDKYMSNLNRNVRNDFAAFETDDFFSPLDSKNNNANNNTFGGRLSVPLPSNDPFNRSGRVSAPTVNNNNLNWSAWGGGDSWAASDDNWATGDNWANSASGMSNKNNNSDSFTTPNTKKDKAYESHMKIDSSKSKNKNLTKEKSPKSGNKVTKSLTQAVTWGSSLGRNKNKTNNNNPQKATVPPTATLPSEEQQLAWAAAEGRRLEEERRERREQEDRELQIAMALSIGNQ